MILPLYFLDYSAVEIFHYFPDLPNHIITTLAIFGPTIGYFDQLFQILRTCRIDGFSIGNSLIMLFTNTLRFFYWYFEPYEIYLLGQSISLFVLQLALSSLYFIFSGTFSVKEKNSYSYIYRYFQELPKKLQNYKIERFPFYLETLHCKDLIDFMISLLIYLILIFTSFCLLCLILGLKSACVVFIYTANVVDPLIAIPPFYQIVVLRKIQGISVILICQSILGDLLKLVLYIAGNSGWSFVLGALIQSAVDLATAFSFFLQRKSIDKDEIFIEKQNDSENLDI